MDKSLKETKIKLHQMFCQHCKAMQKVNGTLVPCWYNPLEHGAEFAFCASSCDVVDALITILANEGYGKIIKCPKFGKACADKNKCEEKYKCDFDDLPCDGEGKVFEPIKAEDKKNG